MAKTSTEKGKSTLSEKVWDRHVVRSAPGEPDLLYIDLHLVHEVTSPQAFDGIRMAGRGVRRPDLTVATADHNVPTENIDQPVEDPISAKQLEVLAANTAEFGITHYGMGDPNQGIVHVIGPEQGRTLPGMTIVCGDSHTSTHGAFGALAFGIGTSEVEHVLATQTLPQQRPGTMAVTVTGELPAGATAKDVILAIIGRIGTGGGIGSVIEYRGDTIVGLSMEGRMTICNMSIEAGAKAGLIAPDEVTFAYLEGRAHAPKGAAWEAALDDWRSLPTDDGAAFGKEVHLDAAGIAPHVSWGTNPAQVVPLAGTIPSPDQFADAERARERRPSPRVHGPHRRHGSARRQRRHRVHRELHQLAHRGPAGGGRGGGGSSGEGRRPHARGARLVRGEAAGRGGGARPGVHRRRVRLARAGLLDVPGHEPRQAGPRGTGGVHQQPQLRGPAGSRGPHAPRLTGRRGGHRHRRPLRPPDRFGGGALMDAVQIVQGTAVPLDRSDVDTDQIIPAEWLKRVERTGFGKGLFASWRDDRSFVLNDERYAGASVLIAGPNFGTGSSREHAVWAIMDYGFQAVISPRFADIFRNNCTKNGLVPVVVPAEVAEQLLQAVETDPTLELVVDVDRRTLSAAAIGLEVDFPLEDSVRERFLEGLDDIGITLRTEDAISDFEATRPAWLPSA